MGVVFSEEAIDEGSSERKALSIFIVRGTCNALCESDCSSILQEKLVHWC